MRLSTPPRPRLVFLSGVVPVFFAIVLAVSRPTFFARLDDAAYDVVVRTAPVRPPAGRVAIVDIDERSLAAVGQWPWRRDLMGRLITALRDSGASVIAVDVLFAEADHHDPLAGDGPEAPVTAPDQALASVIRAAPVVLGYGLTFDPGVPARRPCILHPIPLAVVRPPREEDAAPFFHATSVVCNLPVLSQASGRSGFLNAAPDGDGILRRAPLVAELNGRIYPSLALSAYGAVADATNPALRISTVNASTLAIGDLAVPLDGKSNLLLAFRGRKRAFPYFSAVDVLSGGIAKQALGGKIVLVGTTALGTREVVATPLDTQFVGVEVQATVIDNLLQRDFVHRSVFGPAADSAIILLTGTAIAVAIATSGVTVGLVAAAALLAVFWWGAPWLMTSKGVYISPLPPTVGVLVPLAVMTLARFTVERSRATRASQEKTAAQNLMVQSLLSLTEMRDAETGRHSRRTQRYARLLAEPLAANPAFRHYLTADRIELLSQLAPLHDIGKVGIPDRILNKPGPLTADELTEMRRHPELGRDVIVRAESRVGVREDTTLQLAKDIVYTHHERWDGGGYPRGLEGTEIPVPGRIMALVDVYDAVRTRSLYRQPITHEDAVALIVAGRATHFDPDVVDAFLRVSAEFEHVSREAAESGAAE